MSLIAATDIGGTFTDLVFFDTETRDLGIAKASTTPARLAEGVLASLTTATSPSSASGTSSTARRS